MANLICYNCGNRCTVHFYRWGLKVCHRCAVKQPPAPK